jgi:hypothetical protein
MCKKLNKMGVNVVPEEILKEIQGKSIGRLHIARFLYKRGMTKTIQEAFKKYLNKDRPCYVEKFQFSLEEGVELVLASGGIPVLGHPYGIDAEKIVRRLVPLGLVGIEVYHPEHTEEQITLFKNLAKKYGLISTGGSDCHGLNKEEILIGKIVVDDEVVFELKDAKRMHKA